MEWPPKSGRKVSFPEVDRAAWLSPAEARRKILPGQREFITRLLAAPSLMDPNFRRSVVLVGAHSEAGAMGIVLNRSAGAMSGAYGYGNYGRPNRRLARRQVPARRVR